MGRWSLKSSTRTCWVGFWILGFLRKGMRLSLKLVKAGSGSRCLREACLLSCHSLLYFHFVLIGITHNLVTSDRVYKSLLNGVVWPTAPWSVTCQGASVALLLRSGACSDPCWRRQSAGSTCQRCQNTSVKCEIAVCVIIFFLLSLIYSVPVLCAWFGIRSHHFSALFGGWNKAMWCHFESVSSL